MTILRKSATWQVPATCLAVIFMASLGGCPPPDGGGSSNGDGNGDATLAGNWIGDISYQANVVLNNQAYGQPFEKSLAVAFNDQGQPEKVDLATANGSDVVYLSTANLASQGDTDEQTFVLQSPNGTVKTVKVTATVMSVSRSLSAFSMTLSVKVEFVGAGSVSGTYTVSATLQGDDTVSWASTSDLAIDSDKIDLPVKGSSTGTLSRL